MTETPQDLIARLRSGIHRAIQITLGGVTHDQRCLEAAYAIAASLAREAVLRDALATARADALREAYYEIASASLPVFKPEWTAGQDAAAISTLTRAGEAILAMIPATPPALS